MQLLKNLIPTARGTDDFRSLKKAALVKSQLVAACKINVQGLVESRRQFSPDKFR